MIVIWTRVDITISVCQMINYPGNTNSLINLETGLDVLSYSAHMNSLFQSFFEKFKYLSKR